MTDKPMSIEDAVDYNNLLSEQMTEVPKSLHERVIDAVYALGRVNAEEGGHNGFVTIMLSRLEAMADEIRELEAKLTETEGRVKEQAAIASSLATAMVKDKNRYGVHAWEACAHIHQEVREKQEVTIVTLRAEVARLKIWGSDSHVTDLEAKLEIAEGTVHRQFTAITRLRAENERLRADNERLKPVKVNELVDRYKEHWRDKPDEYWLARLLEEVAELGGVIHGTHDDTMDRELSQIASIAINWMSRIDNTPPTDTEEK